METTVRNKKLSSQSREIVYNVLKFTQQEANENKLTVDLKKVQERVSAMTGVSLGTMKRIAKEGREIDGGSKHKFTAPSAKKQRVSKLKLDYSDQGFLRRFLINLLITEKMVPTVKRLHKTFVEECDYKGSRETLRKEIHNLGFRWRKTKNNRRILMEQHDIRKLRVNYLRTIKQYRTEKRAIVFTGETYLHSDYTNEFNWNDSSCSGQRKSVSKGQKFIIVGAGNEEGFVTGSYLRWKSQSKTGDYHDEMDFNNYTKWLTEKLLVNLQPNSVIVIDNAPYHNKQEDKSPTPASRKANMQKWLRDRNIHYDEEMLRTDLYEIIKLYKPRFIKYAIDPIIRSYGHEVLRLPPNHPDLNPIELVWAALRNCVGARNVTFKLNDVMQLCDDFFNTFPVEEWARICDQVISIEDHFIAKEPMFDVALEQIIIDINSDDDTDETDSDNEDKSYDENEHTYATSDEN